MRPSTHLAKAKALLAVLVCVVALAHLPMIGTAWAEADNGRPANTQKPQFRSPLVNASQAVGADEVDGPTILEGVPALNKIDAARDVLRDRYGIYLHGLYLGDPYANLDGAIRRGATYSGRLDVELDLYAEKLIGVRGGTLHANMFQIHGADLSSRYVGNFLSINDIAALPTTRLYELWYEQRFGDKLSIRAGQQGSDVEFLTSNYSANFINATFGWPGLTSENLPDGGPAYPLATPAVRVKLDPSENVSALAAVFDGEPAGPCADDPQTCDRSGTNFRVKDAPLVLLETQYRYNRGDGARGLPGTFKLGGFHQFGRFDDLGLAAEAGDLVPRTPTSGIYGILDKQVYRVSGKSADAEGDDGARGIGVFTRLIGAPSTRDPIDFYADAGLSAFGVLPQRPDDHFGVAAAVAKVSPGATVLGQAFGGTAAVARPARDFEAVIEMTYQAQIVPGFSIQPTFQYIFHPGGHAPDPLTPARPIRDAAVFGATTAIRF